MSRPPKESDPPEPRAQSRIPRRNAGGARTELTERLTVRAPGFETHGWTLNVSRGGLRAIVEEALSAGIIYEVLVGEAQARRASLVWSQDESDGQIVGMRYLDTESGKPPSEELPTGA